jgi:hypothetical protein
MGERDMGDCNKLKNCKFFEKYESDKGRNTLLNGFVKRYCQGMGHDFCKRKKVSMALGGPENVPINMMPNGFPLNGTDKLNWSEDVLKLL